MLWIMFGMLAMLAGIVVMVLGNLWIGLLLLLGGVVAMAMSYTTMMRGRGQDPDQGSISGVPGGKGKQSSDAVSLDQTNPGEQGPEIWEKMQK